MVAVFIVAALALAACGSSSDDASSSVPKGDCPTAAVPVVVSVDQWGDIVDQLAGDCGDVTTVFKSSSADPHDYEPTPADNARFSGAKLVVENGLDYDPWADKAVATLDTKPVVVNVGKVVGLENGDNPHIWSGPEYVHDIADTVTAELQQLEPKAASYFEQRNQTWRRSMAPYDAEIARIKPAAAGKTYGATEGIFDYMAEALGLTNKTPTGYQRATANGSDPSPGDLNEFEETLAHAKVSVLIYNTQTQGAIVKQVRNKAEADKVRVVDVTESVPPKFSTFVAWQVSQLEHLATALGA
ncbi:MAG TPA: zinc ABC transporter substrate-binding protein [Acidimicrobiia bacterium]|nr:zinc ABC transporter substrate-binding protein [Acidimicrobiia bacterium]